MEPKFNIINRYFLWIWLAIILIIISAFLFLSNLRLSIQFTWGMEIVIDKEISESEDLIDWLTDELAQAWFQDPGVWIWTKQGRPSILLEVGIDTDEQVEKLSDTTRDYLLENWYIESHEDIIETAIIWPSIWDWMKRSAIIAIVVWLILIWIYMLFAFSGVRHYLSPGILSWVVMFTLLFDVLIPAGAYWLFMFFNDAIQVDLIFVVAALTIMGYSINDTIVVFDRIRENIWNNKQKLMKKQIEYDQVFENSLWQIMRRSIATSFSTLLVLIAMFIFGWGIIQLFAFTLMIWVVAGTFSSIFLAAPLAYRFAINKDIKPEEDE